MTFDGRTYKALYWPPKYNYSLSALKEHDEDKYNFLVEILEQVAVEVLHLHPSEVDSHRKHTDYMMATGMLLPVFDTQDGVDVVYFKMWSVFKGEHVSHKELSRFEHSFLDYFFGRMFDVN